MKHTINIRKFTGDALAAAIANSVIFLIAKSADATMVVNQGGGQEIVIPMVLGSSILGLLVGAVAASQIAKKSESFGTNLPVIGLVFGVVTAIAPFTATEDSKTALALASMHLVAGVIWFIGAKKASN
jgi:hypothetical protein